MISNKVTFKVLKELIFTSIHQDYPWKDNEQVDMIISSVIGERYGRYQTSQRGHVKLTPDEIIDLQEQGILRLVSQYPGKPDKGVRLWLGFGDLRLVLGERIVKHRDKSGPFSYLGLAGQTAITNKTPASEFFEDPAFDPIPADAEQIFTDMANRGWFGSKVEMLAAKTQTSFKGPGITRKNRTPKHQIQSNGVRVWNPWLGTDFAARHFEIDATRLHHETYHGPHPDIEKSKVFEIDGVKVVESDVEFMLSFKFWTQLRPTWDAQIVAAAKSNSTIAIKKVGAIAAAAIMQHDSLLAQSATPEVGAITVVSGSTVLSEELSEQVADLAKIVANKDDIQKLVELIAKI